MWIVLAVITFLVGQVYLFRCLRRLDHFLAQHPMDDTQETKILSIAFADPNTAERMSKLLEGFSSFDPDVDLILLTSQDVLSAVYDGRAEVGFLPADTQRYYGLHRMNLTETSLRQEIVWKSGGISAPAKAFLEYLLACGGSDSGIVP